MQIGEEEPAITIEPIEIPQREESPAPAPAPVEVPAEPVPVPAR
jgi:hypothetical protein